MPLKTDYTAGEKLPASDVNAIADSINHDFNGRVFRSIFVSQNFHTDKKNVLGFISGTSFRISDWKNKKLQERVITADWAGASSIGGIVIRGDYVYVMAYTGSGDTSETRIYRYSLIDLSAGGTLCTTSFLGASFVDGYRFFSDSDFFYINSKGGAGVFFGLVSNTEYDITNPSGNTWRYTYNGTGTAPLFITNGLQVGDGIVIKEGTVSPNNQGKFIVSSVAETYFEIIRDIAGGTTETNKRMKIGTGSPCTIIKMSIDGTTFSLEEEITIGVNVWSGSGYTFADSGKYLATDGAYIYDFWWDSTSSGGKLRKYSMTGALLGESISTGAFNLVNIDGVVYLIVVDGKYRYFSEVFV
jgi:hypothetical protein